jgi:uridine kinase
MARWAPEKKEQLDALAAEILHNYGSGRAVVAVDGLDGAGKTHFADDLASAISSTGHSVFRASIDDFHRSRAERHARGADSAEGFYRDSFDYSTFLRVLIEPFKLGGSTAFVTAAFDGIFLNRPELRGLWNYSVWIDVPREIAERRIADRDGPGAGTERYTAGQELYLTEAHPRAEAVAIIDNSDFDRPRRVFADAC